MYKRQIQQYAEEHIKPRLANIPGIYKVELSGATPMAVSYTHLQACREWMNARVLYNAGAYQSAEKEYGRLYPLLRDRASFLFEYGHGLHKQQQFSKSNRILKEALQRSCDPMILNVIGKNYQQMGDCLSAEDLSLIHIYPDL